MLFEEYFKCNIFKNTINHYIQNFHKFQPHHSKSVYIFTFPVSIWTTITDPEDSTQSKICSVLMDPCTGQIWMEDSTGKLTVKWYIGIWITNSMNNSQINFLSEKVWYSGHNLCNLIWTENGVSNIAVVLIL